MKDATIRFVRVLGELDLARVLFDQIATVPGVVNLCRRQALAEGFDDLLRRIAVLDQRHHTAQLAQRLAITRVALPR